MTKEDAAAELEGNEYGSEGSEDLFERMKADGLIALFGYSDDIIEIRGADYDEVPCSQTLHFTSGGMLTNRCDEDDCPYFVDAARNAAKIEIGSPKTGDGMFEYITEIPHARFSIMEDGAFYSVGIVFALKDLV